MVPHVEGKGGGRETRGAETSGSKGTTLSFGLATTVHISRVQNLVVSVGPMGRERCFRGGILQGCFPFPFCTHQHARIQLTGVMWHLTQQCQTLPKQI